MFSWLYGGESATLGMPEIENFYNKVGTVEKYWDGKYVNNPFGRKIECDRFRALNFIIQSTTSDIFLRKAIKIKNALKGKKSYIMGLIHDSMVIDFSGEDREILKSLVNEFSNTEFGKFKVNASIGTNFGNMRKLK
jgi:DNA polymerase I-like protein with 3'-5' exonuclease and polymerase domains